VARTHHHLSRGKPFAIATRASAREDRRPWRSAWSKYLGCPSGKNCTVCGKPARRAALKRAGRVAMAFVVGDWSELEAALAAATAPGVA